MTLATTCSLHIMNGLEISVYQAQILEESINLEIISEYHKLKFTKLYPKLGVSHAALLMTANNLPIFNGRNCAEPWGLVRSRRENSEDCSQFRYKTILVLNLYKDEKCVEVCPRFRYHVLPCDVHKLLRPSRFDNNSVKLGTLSFLLFLQTYVNFSIQFISNLCLNMCRNVALERRNLTMYGMNQGDSYYRHGMGYDDTYHDEVEAIKVYHLCN